MDSNAARELFGHALDKLVGTESDPISAALWCFQDFSKFQGQMLQQIETRILNPPYLDKIKAAQPAVHLVHLLFFIVRECEDLREAIMTRIPDIEKYFLQQHDVASDTAMRQWIDFSFRNGWIPPELIQPISVVFKNQIETATEEVIITPQDKPEEIVEETIEVKPQAFRAWMLPASVWGRGNSEDLSSLQMEDKSKDSSSKMQKYIRVTPENENKRCSVCGGTFTQGNYQHYLVFTDAEYVKGSGLVHTRCKPRILTFLV